MTLIMNDRRLYWIWSHMLSRCYKPTNASYADYGERGITVCDQWHQFPYFESWARASGYESHLTLNRVDNNKGYSPSNCDFITKEEQCRNRLSNHLMPDGSLAIDTARINGIKGTTFCNRIKRGWATTDAVSIPPHKKHKKVKVEKL